MRRDQAVQHSDAATPPATGGCVGLLQVTDRRQRLPWASLALVAWEGRSNRSGRLGQTESVTVADDSARKALLRRGFALEYATLGWNMAGIVVLAVAAISARSVALAGFGLDSLIEIGASTVVIWELSDSGPSRQRRALRLIGYAFAALAAYLLVQSTVVLVTGYQRAS
jgi:hypothetical protein